MVTTDLVGSCQGSFSSNSFRERVLQNWLPVQSNLPSPYCKYPFKKTILIFTNKGFGVFFHCLEWTQNEALNLLSQQGDREKSYIMNSIIISGGDSSRSAMLCWKKCTQLSSLPSSVTVLTQCLYRLLVG